MVLWVSIAYIWTGSSYFYIWTGFSYFYATWFGVLIDGGFLVSAGGKNLAFFGGGFLAFSGEGFLTSTGGRFLILASTGGGFLVAILNSAVLASEFYVYGFEFEIGIIFTTLFRAS